MTTSVITDQFSDTDSMETVQCFIQHVHELAMDTTERSHMFSTIYTDGKDLLTLVKTLTQCSERLTYPSRYRATQYLNKRHREALKELKQCIETQSDTKSRLITLLALNFMLVIISQKTSPGEKQHWIPVTYLKHWRTSKRTRKFNVPFTVQNHGFNHQGFISVSDFVHETPHYEETVESLFSQFEALYGLNPSAETESLLLAWVQSARLPHHGSFIRGDMVTVITSMLNALDVFSEIYVSSATSDMQALPLTSLLPRIYVSTTGRQSVTYSVSDERLLIVSSLPLDNKELTDALVARHWKECENTLQSGGVIYG